MKPIRTRVTARDITEEHRASSPLELLFDLTFVVAIGSLVVELAHRIAIGHPGEAIAPFLMVFFAIWWAWNQFTWLNSAWDADDVPYRIFTMVQMAGVLVLPAGVPGAFEQQDFLTITIGYLIMRLGLLANLVRAMRDDPESRPTAQRYLVGIAIVQVGWLLRLILVPDQFVIPAFIVLATLELLVGPWAGHAKDLAWHPRHIAERYGLFTIILLGESVFASTTAVQVAVADGVTVELVLVGLSGLTLLFTLWWLYFSEPAGDGLVTHRERSYIWGYGHYLIFAALAATGAALEVAVEAVSHHAEAGPILVGYALAIPVASFLLLLWLLHAPIVDRVVIHPVATISAAVVILAIPLAGEAIGTVGVTIAIMLACVILLAITVTRWSVIHAHTEGQP